MRNRTLAGLFTVCFIALAASGFSQSYIFLGSSSWDEGVQKIESDPYTAVASGEIHHFVGDLRVKRVISGSDSTAVPWHSDFIPFGNSDLLVHYDTNVQFSSAGQQAWIALFADFPAKSEAWRKNTDVYGRLREWGTPQGSWYVVGPL